MLRLVFGIVKGLFVGSLVGVALVAMGLGVPAAGVAYVAAALAAALVSTISGKKLWEKGGGVEVILKVVAGLALGPGLMWLVRRFAVLPLPDVTALPFVSRLPGISGLSGTSLQLGSFAVTSLALVAAVLGGWYDLDNTDTPARTGDKPRGRGATGTGRRIDPELAALTGLDPAELEAAEDAAARRKKG